jgi:hypothetical protein
LSGIQSSKDIKQEFVKSKELGVKKRGSRGLQTGEKGGTNPHKSDNHEDFVVEKAEIAAYAHDLRELHLT